MNYRKECDINILTCIFRASQEYSKSRPNASYFNDHRDRSGLSSNICKEKLNIKFSHMHNSQTDQLATRDLILSDSDALIF